MTRIIPAIVLSAVCAALGVSAPVASSEPDGLIAAEITKLKNGLTVVVHEDHRAPRVAVGLWFHAGSKDEEPGKRGLAHLFEHLMFRGSGRERFMPSLDAIGATDTNAATDLDRTVFFETVPAAALEYTLYLEAQRLRSFQQGIGQADIDAEREVIRNEKGSRTSGVLAKIEGLINRSTYPADHPYSRTPAIEAGNLEAIRPADAEEWFSRYYGLSNAVLVMAGDLDVNTALRHANKQFGTLPSGGQFVHDGSWAARIDGVREQTFTAPLPEQRIYRVWNIPAFGTEDSAYLSLAADVLGQDPGGRLYRRLVLQDRLATSVQPQVKLRELGGQLRLIISAAPGQDLRRIDSVLEEELSAFIRNGPSAAELNAAKSRQAGRILRSLERAGGLGGRADLLALSQLFAPADRPLSSLSRIRNATAEQTRAAAARWLSPGHYTLFVTVPPPVTPGSGLNGEGVVPPVSRQSRTPLPPIQRLTLANGLDVLLVERHDLPLVNAWMSIHAGFAVESAPLAGVANIAGAIVAAQPEGAAGSISGTPAELGAELTSYSNRDRTVVRLSALRQNLEPSLRAFANAVLHPEFSQAAVDRQKKLALSAVRAEESNFSSRVNRLLPSVLYGADHPYSAPFSGSGCAGTLESLTVKDLRSFYDTWFRPNNATLVIAGDVTIHEVAPILKELFLPWEREPVPATTSPGPKTQKGIYLLDQPGATESMIVMAFVTPPKRDGDALAVQVASDAFGGINSSRLIDNLRNSHHWSYGVNSRVLESRDSQVWTVSVSVPAQHTAEALIEMQKELAGLLGDRPVTPDELATVQSYRSLKGATAGETLDGIGDVIGKIASESLPIDYFDREDDRLQRLTSANVRESLARSIRREDAVWIIVGDKTTVNPALETAGISGVLPLPTTGRCR